MKLNARKRCFGDIDWVQSVIALGNGLQWQLRNVQADTISGIK